MTSITLEKNSRRIQAQINVQQIHSLTYKRSHNELGKTFVITAQLLSHAFDVKHKFQLLSVCVDAKLQKPTTKELTVKQKIYIR